VAILLPLAYIRRYFRIFFLSIKFFSCGYEKRDWEIPEYGAGGLENR
jgi:hypothetical protein